MAKPAKRIADDQKMPGKPEYDSEHVSGVRIDKENAIARNHRRFREHDENPMGKGCK